MIGALDPTKKQVTVVGAGVAGLLAAWRLDELGFEVTLYEASDRAGGMLRTVETPLGMAEIAAHSFLASPAVRDHFARVGVPLVPVQADSRARFVFRGGRLRRFPLSVMETLRTFFKAYFSLSKLDRDPAKLSMEEWALRHLGRSALDFLISPMLTGIYAAHPSEVSVGAAFPRFVVPPGHSLISYWIARNITRRSKFKSPAAESALSKKGERSRMMAPRGGMSSWVEALEGRLEERLGQRFKRGIALSVLPLGPNVIVCVPAQQAGFLLRNAGDPVSARLLESVEYAPLVSVTAFVERSAFRHEPRGVGVLVPGAEGRDVLGILFNSSAFPDRVAEPIRFASYTLMLGGTQRPDVIALSDMELKRRANLELKCVLGAGSNAAYFQISRWERAIPKYSDALLEGWSKLQAGWCAEPGHVLFGNYTGQVSLRGMIETVSRWAVQPTIS